jgi:hypothetical protein
LVAGLLSIAGCRDATQIRLEIRTNLPCSKPEDGWRGIAVYVGPPGAEARGDAPVLVSHDCNEDGYIGSLVLVPSGDKDEPILVRVVAAISQDEQLAPEECVARNYRECIVARRATRFVPHSTLDLQIELANTCMSLGCDPQYSCSSGSCLGVQDSKPPPPSGLHIVHCGDNDAVCSVGPGREVCCLRAAADGSSSVGECMPPQDCPVDSIVLNCDDESDCDAWDDADGQGECVLSPLRDFRDPGEISHSRCAYHEEAFSQSSIVLALCQDRESCNENKSPCQASSGDPVNRLPGYYWCAISADR